LQKLVVWGASGHALVVADIIRAEREFEIVGFLDDLDPARAQGAFGGSTVLGGRQELPRLREQGVQNVIIAIGDCRTRLELAAVARSHGFLLARAIHPSAVLAQDVEVGEGTVIAAGAVINPSVRIGHSVIVNTSASIDHECIVGDGVHVGPGVRLGGRVSIGNGTWLGIGAVVRDHVVIGERSIIGAGAVVLSDIPAGVVAYGLPAKVVRDVVSRA
jgi:UDP-N-acetylbacillosamine N-acetyltransferase